MAWSEMAALATPGERRTRTLARWAQLPAHDSLLPPPNAAIPTATPTKDDTAAATPSATESAVGGALATALGARSLRPLPPAVAAAFVIGSTQEDRNNALLEAAASGAPSAQRTLVFKAVCTNSIF